MKRMLALAAICLSPSVALGQVAEKPTLGQWWCGDLKSLRDLEIESKSSPFRVTSIVIKQGRDPLSGAPNVSLAAVAVNRSDRSVYLTLEAVALSKGDPVFALVARPIFDGVKPDANAEVNGNTYVPPDLKISAIDRACVRASAYKGSK